MRHGKKFNHLKRKKGHREALLRALAGSLIEYKRISTTLAKAKALRKFVEPIITKGKTNSTHSRRLVFSKLMNKEATKEVFGVIAEKIGDRPGGYVRIIKTGFRKTDAAEMAMIEFVDFNEDYVSGTSSSKTTRRKRRGKKKSTSEVATDVAASTVDTTPAAEDAMAPEVDATPDDLTKVEGIGPKIAEVLNSNGITTFGALAAISADAVKTMLTEAEGNFGYHQPTTWPMQAQMAADGKWDALKKWQDESDGGKPIEASSVEE